MLGERKDALEELSTKISQQKPKALILSSNNLTDESLSHLFPQTSLSFIHSLHINNNSIGDLGMKFLTESLQNSTIELLDLSQNQISDKGVKQLGKIFHHDSKLRQLFIG
jgi:Ran GTPase-activating protein (RanGAP) involved in mRNA processing and transport